MRAFVLVSDLNSSRSVWSVASVVCLAAKLEREHIHARSHTHHQEKLAARLNLQESHDHPGCHDYLRGWSYQEKFANSKDQKASQEVCW